MSKQIPGPVAAICRTLLVIAVIDSLAMTVMPQIPGCPPQITTPVLNYGWARVQPGPKDVTVWVDPDFESNGELGQVQAAITYWNSVGSSLCVPVHFSYTSNHETSNLSIVRITAGTNPNGTHIQPLDIDSTSHVLLRADIIIDIRDYSPSITASYSTVIQKAVIHEIGHSMGLDHPVLSFKGRSIMNNGRGVNDSDNFVPLSLTACDRQSLSHNPQCPSPTPYPTPADDGCYIPPDTNTYPETGCPLGFVDVGEWCDRDEVFQSFCDNHDGYNLTTCICNDGFHPTPTPIPTPTPQPGYCGGAVSWISFPSTGCAVGFANISGNYCDRSDTYKNNCSFYDTGYDFDSCYCNNGNYGCIEPIQGCGLADLYYWDDETCDCRPSQTPIIIDVLGNGYNLTNANDGVSFDMNGDGGSEQIAWTAAGSDDAFLVLDRDADSTITNGTELFGNHTFQPPAPEGEVKNGFLALAVFDNPANGGNNDGRISVADSIYESLRLWRDANHNGAAEISELSTLSESGIKDISLRYLTSKKKDAYGNKFRYRSVVRDFQGNQVGRWAWDVYLRTLNFSGASPSAISAPPKPSESSCAANNGSLTRRSIQPSKRVSLFTILYGDNLFSNMNY